MSLAAPLKARERAAEAERDSDEEATTQTHSIPSRLSKMLLWCRHRRHTPHAKQSHSPSWQPSLPPAVFAHILTFLPFTDKMVSLPCIARTFPRLSPACFRGDSVTATQLAAAPEAVLTHLMRDVRAVSCTSLQGWSGVLRCFMSTLSWPPFTSLRELAVSLSLSSRVSHDSYIAAQLSPLPTVCPNLHTLSVRLGEHKFIDFGVVLTVVLRSTHVQHIQQLSRLRSLTLAGFALTVQGLVALCSLRRLTHLRLGECTILDTTAASPAPLSLGTAQPTWIVLTLPTYHGAEMSVQSCPLPLSLRQAGDALACIDYLLHARKPLHSDNNSSLSDAGPDYISSLWYCRWPAARLLRPHVGLTSLGLHLKSGEPLDASDLSSFINSADNKPCLPCLQHLAVVWDAAFCLTPVEAYSRLLACYSSQLHSLSLKLDVSALSPNLLESIFACSQLRRLVLHGHDLRHSADASGCRWPSTQLGRLHTIILCHIYFREESLAALFSKCPALEDVELRYLVDNTVAIIPRIGASCPRLRRLRVRDQNQYFMFWQRPANRSAVSPYSASIFPSLSILSVVGLGSFAFDRSTVEWLVEQLNGAPRLRYLRVDVDLPLHEVHVFRTFNRLAALRLGRDVDILPSLQRCFTINPLSYQGLEYISRRPSRRRHDRPTNMQQIAEAIAALEHGSKVASWAQMLSDYQQLVDFPHVFASASGRNGRHEFFQSIPGPLIAAAHRFVEDVSMRLDMYYAVNFT